MTQKHVIIILVFLIFGGLIGTAVNKISQQSTVLTPTPSPKPVDFSGLKGNNPSMSPSQSNNPPQKTIKQYSSFPGVLSSEDLANKKAVLQTTKGIIEFEIYPEAPLASSNFIRLTLDGFYDGLTFHRVVKGFVIQGGDPLGTGTGGPGYQFQDEPVTKKYNKGIVAMANAGPNTNGSQFFIMLEDNPTLPPNYTIFGNVLVGQEVVDKIAVGDLIQKAVIQVIK